jgi:hypothetical protein
MKIEIRENEDFKIPKRRAKALFTKVQLDEAISGTTPVGQLIRDSKKIFLYSYLQYLAIQQIEKGRFFHTQHYYRKAGRDRFLLIVEVRLQALADTLEIDKQSVERFLTKLEDSGCIKKVRPGKGSWYPLYLMGTYWFIAYDDKNGNQNRAINANWDFDDTDIKLVRKRIRDTDKPMKLS